MDSCFLKFLKFNNNSPLDTYQFGIRASIQMAQKRNEGHVDCLEKEVGEIREEMQRLPGMEKTVMDLAQNVMRVLQSLEETQKVVAALSLGRNTTTAAQREDRAGWIPGVGEPSGGGMASDETRQGGNGEWRGSRWVEMPVFTGENPDGWIFRADRYFATYGLTEEEKLVAAAMSLDGDALSWYQWTDSREVFGSWENLKRRLLLRFHPT